MLKGYQILTFYNYSIHIKVERRSFGSYTIFPRFDTGWYSIKKVKILCNTSKQCDIMCGMFMFLHVCESLFPGTLLFGETFYWLEIYACLALIFHIGMASLQCIISIIKIYSFLCQVFQIFTMKLADTYVSSPKISFIWHRKFRYSFHNVSWLHPTSCKERENCSLVQ